MFYRLLLHIAFFFLVGLGFNSIVNAQVLLNGTHALNAGGVVYDVALAKSKGVYFAAGDFTNGGGSTRRSIIAIDTFTLNVNTNPRFDMITPLGIDGDIKTIAVSGNYLFVGGNFTTINGSARQGLALFQYVTAFDKYILHSWAPLNSACNSGSETVNALEISGDTLFIGGNYTYIQSALTPPCEEKAGLAAYKISTLSILPFAQYPFFYYTDPFVYTIKRDASGIYVGGKDFTIQDNNGFLTSTYRTALVKLDNDGDVITTFNPTWTTSGWGYAIYDMDLSEHGLYISNGAAGGSPQLSRVNKTTGLTQMVNANGLSNTPVFHDPHDFTYYHNKIYYGSRDLSGATASPHFGYRRILASSPFWSGSLTPAFNDGSVNRVGNRLFVSENNMTSITGQPRTGLAIFCIEPPNAKYFSAYDTTVCPGQQNVIFTVPPVYQAEKYHWFYTGTGADISGNGNSFVFTGTTYNSVSVDFAYGFTAGQLCIVPMSDCNERADTLKINIHVNPVPNANAGLDTVLSCKFPQIDVIGSSTTSGAAFSWTGPMGYTATGSTATVNVGGNYTLLVTDPVLGCTNLDTVSVGYDTIKPNVSMPVGPFQLTCSDTLVELDGSSVTAPTTLEWRKVATGAVFPDPYDANTPGIYTLIITDTLNGCVDSSSLIVSLYQPIPNIALTGYSSISVSVPLDTLTCYTPQFAFEAYSDSSLTTVYFTDTSHVLNYGDSIVVDSAGFYTIYALNSVTGCENAISFYVSEYLNQPDLILPTNTELNCSVDSIWLDAGTLLSGTSITWSGLSFTNVPDPLLVTATGDYIVTNVLLENGCTKTDTVTVTYNPAIAVSAGNDTVVCNGSTVTLSATLPVAVPGALFDWSNGSVGATTNVLVTGLQSYVVHVTDGGSCNGYDTVVVSIPAMPSDSIVAFKPCSGDSTGQLVVFLSGGLAPYTYSLDGSSYQSLNQFTGLPIGNYTVWAKDSLGCDYSYAAEITNNSSLPEPLFLFSTYNFVTDTIALIDVTIPVPDSIEWMLPLELNLLQDGNPALITANDTGVFQVGMKAYYDECEIISYKTIYITEFDSTQATLMNQNGLKTLKVYPNPNTGAFSVDVEFYKKQTYTVGIYDVDGNTWFSLTEYDGLLGTYNVNLPASAINGTYVLRVIGEFDAGFFHFVVSK